MKIHENMQTSLNKIQSTINKLEKLDQTTNVIKRIGQLKNRREIVMNNYLNRIEELGLQ